MSILPATILNSIPFLGIGLVFLSLVYWVPSFFVVYHLTRFGIGTGPKFLAFIFFVGSVMLFSVFVFVVARLDITSLLQQAGNYMRYPL